MYNQLPDPRSAVFVIYFFVPRELASINHFESVPLPIHDVPVQPSYVRPESRGFNTECGSMNFCVVLSQDRILFRSPPGVKDQWQTEKEAKLASIIYFPI